jgi:hypothetical protein
MPETAQSFKVVELDTFDRHGGRALMVHLPPSVGGRARVAFVPMKGASLMTEGGRARLVEELLAT